MNTISLLLPDIQTNGTPVPSGPRPGPEAAGGAPVPFETVLRRHAPEAQRDEPEPREDEADSQREDAAPPVAAEAPATGAAVSPADDTSASAAAAPADPATCPPSPGTAGWAAVAGLAAVLADQAAMLAACQTTSPGIASPGIAGGTLADPLMVLAAPDAGGWPLSVDPKTGPASRSADGGPAADPRLLAAPLGAAGGEAAQAIEVSGPSLAGRTLAAEALAAGPPTGSQGATALAGNTGKLSHLADGTQTLSEVETLVPESLGRDAQGALRDFTSLLPLRKEPAGPSDGQRVSSAEVRDAGGTLLAADHAPASSSKESPAVRPVVEQVATRLVAWADVTTKEGRTVFHLRLEPPELGAVHVHLSAANGAISAKLIAANEAAGQILQSQLHELRESLDKLGVSFASLDVSYDQGGSQGPTQQPELQLYPWQDDSRVVLEPPLVVWQRRSRPAALIDVLV